MTSGMTKVELISHLLRELEADVGTGGTAGIVFESLIDAINSFKCESVSDFCSEFDRLVDMICNTEPKFGVLNYHFIQLKDNFKQDLCSRNWNECRWKREAKKQIRKIIKLRKNNKKKILKYAEKINVNNKTILIHDHSHTVQDVLCHYKYLGKKFKVIIAEQDFDKTHDNIERFYKAGIPFKVVPAYMLSHVHEQIDMAFFGALTLKDSMEFVMDPGTIGTISEFHVIDVPIYMFINTTKFSLWKSRPKGEIFTREHKRMHHSKPIEYDRIKYSHDRVPLKLFSKVVTNEGIFDAKEMKRSFDKKLRDYLNLREKHAKAQSL